jgi:PAS domain S-box-containing protein
MTPDDAQRLLERTFGSAPVGLAVLDADLRYVHVNATLAAINGRRVDEHLDRHAQDVIAEPDAMAAIRRVRDRGEPLEIDISGRSRADPDADHHWVAFYFPLRGDDGAVVGVGSVVIDVTDRRRADAALRGSRDELRRRNEQERFLVEASRILAGSLDLATTLESVADLAVPEIADWCAVDLRDEQGRARNVALAHADPARLAIGRSLRQFASREAQSPLPIQRVIETGRYELYDAAGPELLQEAAADERDRGAWLSLDIRSVMILPMTARGRTIGAISFVVAESDRSFTEDDILFAERLAAQCALAVDNARLFGERSEIARLLQENLLPPLLPDLPGLELAARYRAAGEGNDVGGDFYDVFPTGPSTWLLAIGDVQGKGPAAAAITGLARYTIRAAAMQDPDPHHVLAVLNDAVLRERGGERFLTVVYSALEIADDHTAPRLRVANGGHPRPFLLRADGSVEPVGGHGLLVGIVAEPELALATIDLAPGDAVVLYTDGVIEAGAQIGEDGLARVLGQCAGLDAHAIADRIAGVVFDADGRPRDDVAVLVVRVTPGQPAS